MRPHAGIIAFAAIALLPVLLSLPLLNEPMEQDEGVYFSMAMFDGLPYSSVFDHKPPLVYAWYELSLLLTGEPSIVAIRLRAAVNLSATALAVLWCGRLIGGRRLGWIAGLAMALAVSNQYLQFEANTEVFMLLPMTLAFGCFLHAMKAQQPRWLLLAGALIGIATMTKTVGILQYPALLVVLASSVGAIAAERRDFLRYALPLTAGLGTSLALITAPWILTGHWSEFSYANGEYNFLYSAQISYIDKLFAFSEINRQVLTGGLWLWLLAAFGASALLMRRAETGGATLLAMTLAAFAGASTTGREYQHYWVPIVPFAALLAAVAIDRIIDTWHTRRSRVAMDASAFVVFVSLIAVSPLYLAGAERAHILKYEDEAGAQRAVDSGAVASYITAHSNADDTLFVLGSESQLYILANRRPATYFTRPISAMIVQSATFERTMSELEAAPHAFSSMPPAIRKISKTPCAPAPATSISNPPTEPVSTPSSPNTTAPRNRRVCADLPTPLRTPLFIHGRRTLASPHLRICEICG